MIAVYSCLQHCPLSMLCWMKDTSLWETEERKQEERLERHWTLADAGDHWSRSRSCSPQQLMISTSLLINISRVSDVLRAWCNTVSSVSSSSKLFSIASSSRSQMLHQNCAARMIRALWLVNISVNNELWLVNTCLMIVWTGVILGWGQEQDIPPSEGRMWSPACWDTPQLQPSPPHDHPEWAHTLSASRSLSVIGPILVVNLTRIIQS